MKVLYEGDDFKIIEDDGAEVFDIPIYTSQFTYSFIKGAVEEYERFKASQVK